MKNDLTKGNIMKVLTMPMSIITPIPRIDGILPINRLTLLTALPGSGKSYSLLKFLNLNKITPVIFNLDHDAALQDFAAYHYTDHDLLKSIMCGQAEDLRGTVLIIDTYVRLLDVLDASENTKAMQVEIAQQLEKLCDLYQCTIVVTGHPEDYVGRSSIFKDNQYLVRCAEEHLHMDKILSTKKGTPPEYRMYVNKGRGISGTKIIDNWLREPVLNPLTNKMC